MRRRQGATPAYGRRRKRLLPAVPENSCRYSELRLLYDAARMTPVITDSQIEVSSWMQMRKVRNQTV